MAKRFIDTDLFDDSWFMELSLSAKVFWMYCITKCDHAGILELNIKLAQFQTGIKSMETVIKELGNRLVSVNEQYYFIPKYIEFQYPGFPNSKVRQQASAVEILKKFNLFDNSLQTVSKELINSYVNVTVTDNVIEPEKKVGKVSKKCLMKNSNVSVGMVAIAFAKTDDLKNADAKYYFNICLDWSDSKNEMRTDWVATVRSFARRDLKDGKLKISDFKQDGGSNLSIKKPVKDPEPESKSAMTREEWKNSDEYKQKFQKS